MPNSVTIIIPVNNEEQSIGSVIDEIQQVLKKENLTIPIMVVDDGSTDKTSDIAKSKNVQVFRHEENRGYGAALKTGIHRATTEFIIIMDADKTYPASVIPQMLQHTEMYDMVVGNRNTKPSLRVFAKWFLIKLA